MSGTCAACGAPLAEVPGFLQDEAGNLLGEGGKPVGLDDYGRPKGTVQPTVTLRCSACGLKAPEESKAAAPAKRTGLGRKG